MCSSDLLQVEVAHDALVLLKLKMSPLAVVDKLLQGLLQIVKHAFLRARDLCMVDGNLCLQFLRREGCRITADEPAHQ